MGIFHRLGDQSDQTGSDLASGKQTLQGSVSSPEEDQPTDQVSQSNPEEPTSAQKDVQQNKQEKVIVLDGPLSQIYTNALREVFAQEDVAAMIMPGAGVTGDESLPEEQSVYVNDNGSFVYVVDSDSLDGQGLVQATESVRVAHKRYKKVVLSLESRTGKSSKAAILDGYARSLGVSVYYNRQTAIQAIKG